MDPLSVDALLQHRDFVRALARRLLQGGDVDDVEQATWIAALERRPDPDRSLAPWLARATRLLALQRRRGESRRRARERRAAGPERTAPSPEDVLAHEEARREVVRAVLALEEKARDVVLLHFYEGLPPRAIARRLGIPVETAKSRLKRALARLRGELKDRRTGGRHGVLAAVASGPFGGSTLGGPVSAGGALLKLKLAGIGIVLGLALSPWLWTGRDDAPSATAKPAQGAPPLAGAPDVAGHDAVTPAAETREVATSSPAVTAGRIALPGRVLGEDGAGIAGASVRLVAADGDGERVLAEGSSDAAGAFALEAADLPAQARLVASKPGLSDGAASGLRAGESRTLLLVAPRAVAGRVIDAATLAPIGDAIVRLHRSRGFAAVTDEVRTANDGSFRIDACPGSSLLSLGRIGGSTVFLEAIAGGYAPRHLALPDQGSTLALDVHLLRGSKCIVRVLDADTRAPLANAELAMWSLEGAMIRVGPDGAICDDPAGRRLLQSVVTDADGRATLERLPSIDRAMRIRPESIYGDDQGPILGYVGVRRDGYALSPVPVHYAYEGAGAREVELIAYRAARLVGRVVDERGAPVGGAKVWLIEPFPVPHLPPDFGADLCNSATTGVDGRFELTRVPSLSGVPLPVTLCVAVDACLGKGWHGRGETDCGDLVVARAWRVAVAVRDSEGRPIVHAVAESREFRKPTDVAGLAVLMLPEDETGERPVKVAIHARGYREESVDATPARGEPEPVAVTLAPERRIAVQALFADGTPAAAAFVYAVATGAGPSADALAACGCGALGEIDGLGPLPDAPVDLYARISVPGGPTCLASRLGVAASEDAAVLRFAEPARALRARLAVTVRDTATGASLSGARVSVAFSAYSIARVLESETGRFVLDDLAPATVRVLVEADSRTSAEIEDVALRAGETRELEVPLAPQARATVTGRVLLPEGVAPDGFTLALVDAAGGAAGRSTGPLTAESAVVATFALADVPPGRRRFALYGGPDGGLYALEVAPEIDVGAQDVALARPQRVVAGGDLLLSTTMADPGDLEARIETAAGECVSVARCPEPNVLRRVAAPPGEFVVRWMRGGSEVGRTSIRVAAGQLQRIVYAP